MNKIQDFLKRKGIEDKIVDYDENNEPLTPSYIIEEWEKEQLRIGGVVASVLCVNSEGFGGLTKNKKYPLIKEDSIHYTITNDFGNEFWYLKNRFVKI